MFIEPLAAAAARAKRWNARFAGKPMLSTRKRGYRWGHVLAAGLYAHRVAWAVHYGRWPEASIDHINGVRDDNRLFNLREAPDGANDRNRKRPRGNRSGVVGVFRRNGKWCARITYRQCSYSLGRFATKEAAAAARKAAERRFGFHENHGRER